jgi:hypothetical protein
MAFFFFLSPFSLTCAHAIARGPGVHYQTKLNMMYPIASLEPGGLCLDVKGSKGLICTKKIQEVSTVFFNTETSGIDPPLAPDLAAAFAFASNKYGFFGCQSKEDSKGLQLMKLMKLKLPEAARSALRKPLEFH